MFAGTAQRLRRSLGLSSNLMAPSERDWALVQQIQNRSEKLERQTNQSITAAAMALRERCGNSELSAAKRSRQSGTEFDACVLVEGCSLVREAVRRETGKSYFPVQILAGLVLSRGAVAEMATGEGKTLTSVIPVFLNAVRLPGVHVATPNAYLADRDFRELEGVYKLLGLTAGLLPEIHHAAHARSAYQCDVTYGAGYAFGFDFLRDELTRRQRPVLRLGEETIRMLRGHQLDELPIFQTGHWCGLVDEIDSVLMDEAMTPLILSVASEQSSRGRQLLKLARLLADALERGLDFQLHSIPGSVQLTSSGFEKADAALSHPENFGLPAGASLQEGLQRPWFAYVENALQAKYVLQQDVDYVIREGLVQIVDQKTGRIFGDRSWSGGLHQAVEERAGVDVTAEKSSVGRMTRQSYYRLYHRLCGMTGTVKGAETEFRRTYQLRCVEIPLHRPSLRINLPDRYFADCDAKFAAVVAECAERHISGQPVLIGTRTISDSQELSQRLAAQGISHVVLNGKQDEKEADIVLGAGRAGRVTVATNMAGRGTDIQPDARAVSVGGLYVIGVERHETRRIDRQLAGRAARAGAPGTCRFFLSADDTLISSHAPQLSAKIRSTADSTGESHRDFSATVRRLQSAREKSAAEMRTLMMLRDRDMHDMLKSLCYRTDD